MISTRVPPVPQVANISWKAPSKLKAANWRVFQPGPASECRDCQSSRAASGRCGMATPLGTPVEPEV